MMRIGFQARAPGATGFLWGRQNYFLICVGAAVLAQRRRWRPRHRDLYVAHFLARRVGRIGTTALFFHLLPSGKGEELWRGVDDDAVGASMTHRPLQPRFLHHRSTSKGSQARAECSDANTESSPDDANAIDRKRLSSCHQNPARGNRTELQAHNHREQSTKQTIPTTTTTTTTTQAYSQFIVIRKE